MRRPVLVIGAVLLSIRPGVRADAPPAARPRPTIEVWDTSKSSDGPRADAEIGARTGWTDAAAGRLPSTFQGDAVVSGGRLVVVARPNAGTVDVYAARPGSAVRRLALRLADEGGALAGRFDRVALVEAGKSAAALELAGKTAAGASVSARVRVKRGDVALRVEPLAGAGRLRVECPSRHVVLPDFFADDIVIDARELPVDHAEVPADNFVMHLAGQGDALAVCVFENRKQDVGLVLEGAGAERRAVASEVGFEGKPVWVALLDAPGVWHTREVSAADAGKVLPLGWSPPFTAQWRCDFRRSSGLADSWEMLLPAARGPSYVKPSWMGAGSDPVPPTRKRWNTVLGSYPYPCWIDHDGQGQIQPLKSWVLKFEGPLVVYPINRQKETPLDAYTVVDLMRNTLGVGPCEYILDLEGQKAEYRGRATCAVRDALTPIYTAGEQATRRAEVDRVLDEGLTFVKHIRSRITRYVEFSRAMRAELAERKKEHPELADAIDDLVKTVGQIDAHLAARAGKIQTPEHVAAMNEAFRRDVLDDTGPDALAKCRAYTKALVTIGDNQDELSGECRWVVKTFRQKAALLTARDPRLAPIAATIRTKTQEALRNPANHESAHH